MNRFNPYRRKILLLLLTTPASVLAALDLESTPLPAVLTWDETYVKWCHLLLSGDVELSDECIHYLLERAQQKSKDSLEFEQQLKAGLMRLGKIPATLLKTQLTTILQSTTETGYFARQLHHFLLGEYYGSPFGWRDLRFEYPPQPYGFIV